MSHEPVPYPNPSQRSLRASDADRSLVTELLGAAYAEGRLDRDEYDTRIQSALSAKTFDDLAPLTRDLTPVHDASAPSAPASWSSAASPATDSADTIVTLFSGVERKGRWRARRNVSVLTMFGGTDIDLTQAQFDADVCEINIFCLFGGVDIRVPEGVAVENRVTAIFGGAEATHPTEHQPGAPRVVVKGFVGFGGVEVRGPKRR